MVIGFHYFFGILLLLLAIVLPRAYDALTADSGIAEVRVIAIIDFSLIILGLLVLIIGRGLHSRRPWSRIGAVIFAILFVPLFPVGTAMGAFLLWYLASDRMKTEFSDSS